MADNKTENLQLLLAEVSAAWNDWQDDEPDALVDNADKFTVTLLMLLTKILATGSVDAVEADRLIACAIARLEEEMADS